jgi:hypothetical protein
MGSRPLACPSHMSAGAETPGWCHKGNFLPMPPERFPTNFVNLDCLVCGQAAIAQEHPFPKTCGHMATFSLDAETHLSMHTLTHIHTHTQPPTYMHFPGAAPRDGWVRKSHHQGGLSPWTKMRLSFPFFFALIIETIITKAPTYQHLYFQWHTDRRRELHGTNKWATGTMFSPKAVCTFPLKLSIRETMSWSQVSVLQDRPQASSSSRKWVSSPPLALQYWGDFLWGLEKEWRSVSSWA